MITTAATALVADIGGTHARFGCLRQGMIEQVRTLPVAAHDGLAAAAQAYLNEAAAAAGATWQPPRRAALAVATAITGDPVELTNSGWTFSQASLRKALSLDELVLVNDFEALALALPYLQAQQLHAHAALPSARATRAVIGPGTGLGVAAVVPQGGGWLALASEGGHATLAAGDDFEAEVVAVARRGLAHVSAERLLSGSGLPLLHRAVAEVRGAAAVEPLDTVAIVERGTRGDGPCRDTLETFCAMLGGFAGNVVLTLGARGGLYIGGGIVPRMREVFFASRFRARFEAKGRLAPYLAPVPTALITDTLAALTGAAVALGAVPGAAEAPGAAPGAAEAPGAAPGAA